MFNLLYTNEFNFLYHIFNIIIQPILNKFDSKLIKWVTLRLHIRAPTAAILPKSRSAMHHQQTISNRMALAPTITGLELLQFKSANVKKETFKMANRV
jgi:hypothetical protein